MKAIGTSSTVHACHGLLQAAIIFLVCLGLGIWQNIFLTVSNNVLHDDCAQTQATPRPWGTPLNLEEEDIAAAIVDIRTNIEKCPEFKCNNHPIRRDCTNTAPSPYEYGKPLPQISWSSVVRDVEEECSRTKLGSWDFDGNDNIDFIVFHLFFFPELLKTGQTPAGRVGFQVEFGASDGISASNSRFFENHLGWETLLLEPTSCHVTVRKTRPRARVVHGAVCRIRQNITMPGASSWCPGTGVASTEEETVQCYPLKEIFESHGIAGMVDFVSVDSEGMEMEALESIDFSKVDIRVLVVEWRESDGSQRRDYMAKFGYKSTFVSESDELFWRPDLF